MPYQLSAPFAFTMGPKTARIALVQDYWGDADAEVKMPFQGYYGKLISEALGQADIRLTQTFRTSVFPWHPPTGKLLDECRKKSELPEGYSAPPIASGKYLPEDFLGERGRVLEELQTVKPHVTILFGAVATWAVLGHTRVQTARGVIAPFGSEEFPLKALPTYAPGVILGDWAKRPIWVVDMMKGRRESEYPEIRRPKREVLIRPSLRQVEAWVTEALSAAKILSCDIETKRGQITCIGFAWRKDAAICIPFVNHEQPGYSYWGSVEAEAKAWKLVERLLQSPIEKLFQNGLYDLQYLYRAGLKTNAVHHDTMLLSHALYPEMPKGLGFLGSMFCNEVAWKSMRNKSEDYKANE